MEKLKEELEKNRTEFLNYFKKARLINTIVLVGAIILFVAVVIVMHKINQDTIALIICAVIVIALFFYVKNIKKSIANYTQNYIKNYYNVTTKEVMNENNITEFEDEDENVINLEIIEKASFMKDINYTRSRNNISFNYEDHHILLGDLLFKTIDQNDRKNSIVAFCGKFLQYETNKTYNGRTIIYRKCKGNNGVGPTDIDSLEKVLEDEDFIIYSSNKDFEKDFNKKTLSLLRSIEIDDVLYDFTISLTNNVVTMAFSYSDSLMVIPLYEETPIKSFDKFSSDFATILKVIQSI